MDSWKEEQVKRMKLGGNRKALEFFKSHPDWVEGMGIQEKYTSEFARLYKEKLDAVCEGREWTAPPFSKKTPLKNSPLTTSSTGYSKQQASYGSSNNSDISNFNLPSKARNEDEKSKAVENENRSESLPPNQGGKYVGFGNPNFSNAPQKSVVNDALLNDALGTLSLGWSILSSTAQTAAGVAGSLATEGAKAAVAVSGTIGSKVSENLSPEVRNGVTGFVTGISARVADTSSRGISYISTLVNSGVYVPERHTYSSVDGEQNWNDSEDMNNRKSEDGWDSWQEFPENKSNNSEPAGGFDSFEEKYPQNPKPTANQSSWNEGWDESPQKNNESTLKNTESSMDYSNKTKPTTNLISTEGST
ncbi:ADP-ribosylation factor GTPase-activating protein 1, partial [Nowakowskiella sp. JEL0078]